MKYVIPLFLVLAVYVGSRTISYKSVNVIDNTDARDTAYAGSLACRSCHRAIYDSFMTTAHNQSSAMAAADNIKGSFEKDSNVFKFNQLSYVLMGHDSNGFFQSAHFGETEFQRAPMDITIGSARKGQTYLYWRDNVLLQDPISYYTPADCWCNSPGYPKMGAFFERVTNARCLECHASYAKTLDGSTNNIAYIEKNNIIYGIDCERCHGPAKTHVLFHSQHPDVKNGLFILAGNGMTRQLKLDVCGLCHSGIRVPVTPPFTYVAGTKLSNYSSPKYDPDSAALLDVHGNQYGLLSSSKCFLNSQMTCSSCHNVHQTEIGQPRLYSARCMECHNQASHHECTVKVQRGLVLSDNCIDCHMPVLPSKAIFLQLENNRKSTADFVRTHRVAIYQEVSRKFINKIKVAAN